MPLMVTRLILSLKKAANSPGPMLSFHELETIVFARRTIGGAERGGGDIDPLPKGKRFFQDL